MPAQAGATSKTQSTNVYSLFRSAKSLDPFDSRRLLALMQSSEPTFLADGRLTSTVWKNMNGFLPRLSSKNKKKKKKRFNISAAPSVARPQESKHTR